MTVCVDQEEVHILYLDYWHLPAFMAATSFANFAPFHFDLSKALA